MKASLYPRLLFSFLAALFLTFAAQAQTVEDKTKVIQLCLDLPDLQPYLQFDPKNGFDQMYILDNGKILKTLELEKFGKKVIIGGVSQLPLKANFVEFTKADFKAAFADVVFTYPEENIQVEAKFSKKNNKWTRVSSKIKEMK